MKVKKYETQEDWFIGRRGKITGSKASGTMGFSNLTIESMTKELDNLGIEWDKKMKKPQLESLLPVDSIASILTGGSKGMTFYEIVAERLSIPDDEYEDPRQRGHRLESEAIRMFSEDTGKKVREELEIWEHDEYPDIAVSPDGTIGKNIEAVEVKCLESKKHVKAFLTKEIPDEYDEQSIQYFAVNDKLKTLWFVFYDPRMSVHSMFYFKVERKDVQHKIELYLKCQIKTLEHVENAVSRMTF